MLSNQRRTANQLLQQSEKTNFLTLTSTTVENLSVEDKVNVVTVTGSVNAVLMLPPVSEMMGEIISIRGNGLANQVTVVAYGDGGSLDDAVDWTDLVLTADDDFVVLYSDGYKWFILAEQTT